MKSGVSVYIKDATKYINKVEKSIRNKGIPNSMQKATLFVQGEVKQSIAGHRAEKRSVDTGRFLNSVDIYFDKKMGQIFTKLEYAKFLEYGTSSIRARKHFRNTKARTQSQVDSIFQKYIL